MPELLTTHCPYCGEAIELCVDDSAGAADYIEDCPVCCQPMRVQLEPGEDGPQVRVDRDDD